MNSAVFLLTPRKRLVASTPVLRAYTPGIWLSYSLSHRLPLNPHSNAGVGARQELVKHHLTTATSPYAMNSAFFQSLSLEGSRGLPAPASSSLWEGMVDPVAEEEGQSQRTPLLKQPRAPLAAVDTNAAPGGARPRTQNYTA